MQFMSINSSLRFHQYRTMVNPNESPSRCVAKKSYDWPWKDRLANAIVNANQTLMEDK